MLSGAIKMSQFKDSNIFEKTQRINVENTLQTSRERQKSKKSSRVDYIQQNIERIKKISAHSKTRKLSQANLTSILKNITNE